VHEQTEGTCRELKKKSLETVGNYGQSVTMNGMNAVVNLECSYLIEDYLKVNSIAGIHFATFK